jgi:hypothetical protein
VTCRSVTQAAYRECARAIVGQTFDDAFQDALEVKPFGSREVFKQWRHSLGS